MFAVKIYHKKSNRNSIFNKTIENILTYINNLFNFNNIKTASDSDCIEITAGKQTYTEGEDKIIAELLIKKTIIISQEDLLDRQKLDIFVSKIKFFCEQAEMIDDLKYKPLHLRDKE